MERVKERNMNEDEKREINKIGKESKEDGKEKK
jgi:hypothetical protein